MKRKKIMRWFRSWRCQYNAMGIKWKLFLFLTGFCAVMIIILWLFQIVFLDNFYQAIKINSIRSSAGSIEKNISSENLDALIERISESNDVCVTVMTSTGIQVADSDILRDCVIHKMPSFETYRLFVKARDNGGELLEYYKRDGFKNHEYDDTSFFGKVPPKDNGMSETIIYSKIVTDSSGTEYMILLNSVITPVDSTVQTLRIQLYWITGIMIILAIVMALIIAKRIAKPIIAINNSAGELAKGDYNVAFEGKGYREISELAATLNYAAKELSKVDGLRRELIANISHDLRTPLTLIEGYGEVMRDLPGENTPENVQVIIDEARRLTSLVNDVLDISKLQPGTQTLHVTRFSLTAAVREIMGRFTKLCEQDGYVMQLEADSDVFVNADEIRISQVIYNLLGNAINYTGADRKVSVRQTVIEGAVLIEVADSGEGIPEEMLPYVWERYYKVDKSHKRAVMGTGLGLTIVKSIIDMHDGADCGVKSKVGEGSVFWFKLKI